uniref:Heparan-alpha-glucosaminide N-acetyltransferase n=1 Tax=Cyprinodon variegatus TaxID=28743 RepID=A0A3Q2E4T5_CYPVA
HIALKMDEALLTVINDLETDLLWLCVTPGWPPMQLWTRSLQFHFGEHGNYSLWLKNLNNVSHTNCSIMVNSNPVNSYIRECHTHKCLIMLCSYSQRLTIFNLLMRPLYLVLKSSHVNFLLPIQELGSPRMDALVTDNILPSPASSSRRLRSLDTFRGISLVIMVFVNYGGGRYWFFKHSSWNGEPNLDLFVFIMGTSIALSINSMLRGGKSRSSLLRKVLWRSIQLFLIGLFIVNPNYCLGPLSFNNLRIPGVLQRLAWSYLVVASLDLLVDAWWSPGLDVLLYWPAWLCVVVLEIIWLCLTFLLPVPDCPTGYLGPGGIGDMGLHVNCTGGAAGYIDRWLLGENHIYQSPSSKVIYATHMPYDPEGVLGSINSVLMAFLGLQVSIFLFFPAAVMVHLIEKRRIITLTVLTECSTDKGFIPVNKNLWSLSYVTTLACFAFVLLLLVYYTIDVKKWWSGAPFYYPGMNSILVYVGHEVFEGYFPFRWRMVNSQSHTEHLIQNVFATSLWVFISYILYRKRIFWKI